MSLDPRAESSVLGNGLRVVTVALPHLHTVTLALYLHAGPRHESPDENGLSHMTEHMLFRGTARHRTSRAVSEAVEALGATLDGATDRDLSVLHMSLPPEGWPTPSSSSATSSCGRASPTSRRSARSCSRR